MRSRAAGHIDMSLLGSGAGRIARKRSVLLAGAVLALLLAAMASAIVLSQGESRQRLRANLGLRGQSSAAFISTFLLQQAARERQDASAMLAGPRVAEARFRLVVDAFGSGAAVLLDGGGRLLDVIPADPAL